MSALGIALLSIGLFVVGGGIGFYLARLGQAANSAKLDEVESEYDDYRRQVTEHFGKTAEQIHTIGQQYRDLYEHLASGSEALCKLESPTAEPPFPLVSRETSERPEVSEPVAEEVLVAAAAVTTAAGSDEMDEPAELVDAPAPAESDDELVTAVAEAEEDVVAETETEDDVTERVAGPEAADGDDTDDVVVDAADDETPDNVVELVPRDETGDDGSDGERSIR